MENVGYKIFNEITLLVRRKVDTKIYMGMGPWHVEKEKRPAHILHPIIGQVRFGLESAINKMESSDRA